MSLSLEGGGGRGAGGAGGELSAGRGRGDGQGHGAGLLLHPLDTTQNTSEQRYVVTFKEQTFFLKRRLLVFVGLTVPCFRRSRRQRQKDVHFL